MSWPNLARLKGEDAESCYYSTVLEKTQMFLDNKCKVYSSPPLSIDKVMQRLDGSLNRGDFSLRITKYNHPNMSQDLHGIAEALKRELGDIYSDCSVVGNSHLKLTLNRERAYSCGLRQVLSSNKNLGARNRDGGKVLLVTYDDGSTSLTNFRTRLLSEHAAAILLMNGRQLYCKDDVISNAAKASTLGNLCQYFCDECDCNTDRRIFEELCVKSSWRETEGDFIALNARKYLSQTTKRLVPHDKNLDTIYLKKADYTQCFEESAHIHHLLNKHAKEIDIILCIYPINKQFLVQQCALVLEMVLGKHPRILLLIHQQVLENSLSPTSSDLYRQKKRSEMEEALIEKYDEGILNDETWLSVVNVVTDSVVKFDFLLTGPTVPLRIDLRHTEFGARDRGGAFVQYNCARLSRIFKCYNEKLKAGTYEQSPALEDTDFSQLTLQEEWTLFFNYVLPFTGNISSLLDALDKDDSLEINISTNRICQFLVNLSHDLSIYYNKNRVLVHSYPSLVMKMYPRLFLLQALHKVMESGLSLLNLTAVKKM